MKAYTIKTSRKTMMSYMGMSGGLFIMGVMLAVSGIAGFALLIFLGALSLLAFSAMHTRLRCDVENDTIYRDYVLLGYLMYFEKIALKPTSEFYFYFEDVPMRSGGIREVARFVVRDRKDIMMQDEITLAFATEPGVVNVLVRVVDKVSDLFGRPVNDQAMVPDQEATLIEENVPEPSAVPEENAWVADEVSAENATPSEQAK